MDSVTGVKDWDSPRQSIEAECKRRGKAELVAACVDLVRGQDGDPDLLFALAGPGARWFVEDPDREDRYWLRVWGMRGLLWAWDDAALPAIRLGAKDEAWRVREMAAKVVARNLIGDAL